MKFTSKEDIEVPIDHVFDMLTDFERHERSALRRGAEVERMDDLANSGLGSAWKVKFMFRGKLREADLRVTTFDRPNELEMSARASGLDVSILFELVALSRRRTRLNLTSELSPKTLSAKLLVQSLKLAKGNLKKRLDGRMASNARELETRYRNTA